MRRMFALVALAGTAVACRTYDNYDPIANQDGLVPASTFARYGTEQAEVAAIGRALDQWYVDDTREGRAKQTTAAVEYARKLPGVASITVDTMSSRLTVVFKSGWRTFVIPIHDGVKPEDTPNLPKAG
ncbi:MAG: hypothetical protein ABI647_08060 [Gemmatimonadota bacterium]